MLNLRAIGLVLTVCSCAGSASLAQPACISVSTRVSVADMEAWLRSGDLGLIGWGAYFAGESQDDGVVTTMMRLVEHGHPYQIDPNSTARNPCPMRNGWPGPMYAVLDALIKRNEPVSP